MRLNLVLQGVMVLKPEGNSLRIIPTNEPEHKFKIGVLGDPPDEGVNLLDISKGKIGTLVVEGGNKVPLNPVNLFGKFNILVLDEQQIPLDEDSTFQLRHSELVVPLPDDAVGFRTALIKKNIVTPNLKPGDQRIVQYPERLDQVIVLSWLNLESYKLQWGKVTLTGDAEIEYQTISIFAHEATTEDKDAGEGEKLNQLLKTGAHGEIIKILPRRYRGDEIAEPVDTNFGVEKKHMKGLYELGFNSSGEAPHLCFPVGVGPKG